MKKVGRNPKARFCAFGDDSAYKDVLAYAYAIFHRKNIIKAENELNDIKSKFNIPLNVPIHCRILFSGNQRQKANLGHLTLDRVKSLISQLIDRMNQVPCLLRYAYCILPESGEIFLKVNDKEQNIVQDEPKGVLGILSQTCFLPLKNQPYVPGAELCEIFASMDKTKIKFIGKRRRRADSYSSGLSIESPQNNGRVRITPNVGDHQLQQIADVYAYICSHALSSKCTDNFFEKQLNKVKYFTRAIAYPDSKFEEIGLSKTSNT